MDATSRVSNSQNAHLAIYTVYFFQVSKITTNAFAKDLYTFSKFALRIFMAKLSLVNHLFTGKLINIHKTFITHYIDITSNKHSW